PCPRVAFAPLPLPGPPSGPLRRPLRLLSPPLSPAGRQTALSGPVPETAAGRSVSRPPAIPRRPATGIDGPGNGNGGRQISLAAAVQSTEAGNRHWCPVTETAAGTSLSRPPTSPRRPATRVDARDHGNGGQQISLAAVDQQSGA